MRYTIAVGTARLWLATNTFALPGAEVSRSPPALPKAAPPAASPSLDEIPPIREIWGNPASLRDHFERHGADFKARNADQYARMAWEFLKRAKREGLPAKLDDDNVLRVFDPKTQAFGAYNKDGTARTFFKPRSRTYFERQPGKSINLKTWK
jgi:pyocin large subunit-like protein